MLTHILLHLQNITPDYINTDVKSSNKSLFFPIFNWIFILYLFTVMRSICIDKKFTVENFFDFKNKNRKIIIVQLFSRILITFPFKKNQAIFHFSVMVSNIMKRGKILLKCLHTNNPHANDLANFDFLCIIFFSDEQNKNMNLVIRLCLPSNLWQVKKKNKVIRWIKMK